MLRPYSTSKRKVTLAPHPMGKSIQSYTELISVVYLTIRLKQPDDTTEVSFERIAANQSQEAERVLLVNLTLLRRFFFQMLRKKRKNSLICLEIIKKALPLHRFKKRSTFKL